MAEQQTITDYICTNCNTFNEVWAKRENTVGKDIVYCWHCGTPHKIGDWGDKNE